MASVSEMPNVPRNMIEFCTSHFLLSLKWTILGPKILI
jgi:hypothetical protein